MKKTLLKFMGPALLIALAVLAGCSNPSGGGEEDGGGGGGGGQAVLTGIQITGPAKTDYALNEPFDSSGLTVTAVYDNGSTAILGEGDYILIWNGGAFEDITAGAGVKTVTVIYREYTGSFTITVDLVLDHIEITPPTKTVYVEGASFDSAGLVVTAVYDNSDTAVLDAGKYTLTWDEGDFEGITAEEGTKTVTVSYRSKTNTFTITVTPPDAVPPAAVSGLGGTTASGQVTLTWTDPEDEDLDYIEITWTPDGTVPQTVAGGFQTKTITGLTNGTAYTFTLRAVDASGNRSAGEDTGPLTPDLDLSAIAAALDAAAGTLGSPALITTDLLNSSADWAALLTLIAAKGKYVALDLSDCGMTGTFYPGTANTGENKITSLVLPDTVTEIPWGEDSSGAIFRYFSSLKSVGGTGVTEVGSYVFSGCAALETTDFPAMTYLGNYTFDGCIALETVYFPALTSFNERTFSGCTALKSVDLPSVTYMTDRAFYNLKALETVNLPKVNWVPHHVFYGCIKLKTINIPKVKWIDEYAFYDCLALETVNAQAVLEIERYAFYRCRSLKAADFPAAEFIGAHVSMSDGYNFYGCTALETVNLPKVERIEEDAFSGCTALKALYLPAATDIGSGAFLGCTSLKTIDLSVLTTLHSSTIFGGCTSLETVNLPEVTYISAYTFRECVSLKTVTIPKVEVIEQSAFYECTALETIHLPATLTSVEGAFRGCANLTTITVDAANPKYQGQGGMLLNKAGDTLLAYPGAHGSLTSLPSTVTIIGDGVFYERTSLTSVNLPSVTIIGDRAFDSCYGLTTVNLPAAVSVGDSAFYNCEALGTVNLPVVTSIGGSAFRGTGNKALTITLPKAAPAILNPGNSGSFTKNVTIKTPAGRTGYDAAWQSRFKNLFYNYNPTLAFVNIP